MVEGLEKVENSIVALGSVWAVTSNQPDEFSPGEVQAAVVRIEPSTGRVEPVLVSPGVEPTLVEAGGRVWVKLVDRVAALDRDGTEVVSVPFRLGRSDDLTSAGERLWVVLHDEDRVVGLDPATGETTATVATGDFPVGPLAAFGLVWIVNLIDGTITIVDPDAAPDRSIVTEHVTDGPKFLTPVPGGASGDEVWVTSTAGDVFAISAEDDDLGEIRRVVVDRSINSLAVDGRRAVLLPTWGSSVLVLDLETEAILAEIPIDSIPVRALAAGGLVWVTGDGGRETLTAIDPGSLTIRGQFRVGSGRSNTTGPQRPLAVDGEIWVPNRGDDAFFIVGADDL